MLEFICKEVGVVLERYSVARIVLTLVGRPLVCIRLCRGFSLVQASIDFTRCSASMARYYGKLILNLLLTFLLISVFAALVVRSLHLRADCLHEQAPLVDVIRGGACTCTADFTRLCTHVPGVCPRVAEHFLGN